MEGVDSIAGMLGLIGDELGQWGAITMTDVTKVRSRENFRASGEGRDLDALRSLDSISCATEVAGNQ